MAWPRIKNSRSSAQPGTHTHEGVQATVTPAPGAEAHASREQNTGVSGTRHTVGASPAPDWPPTAQRLRPIRYAHSGTDETTADTPAEQLPPAAVPTGRAAAPLQEPVQEPAADYDQTWDQMYEVGPDEPAQPAAAEPVRDEGLGIFGDVKTTEVTDDRPTRHFARPPHRVERPAPPLDPAPEPRRVIPIGATFNQPIASATAANEPTEESKPRAFGLLRGKRGGGEPAADEQPRKSMRDLPLEVQLRFWRLRAIIMVIVGAVFMVLTRSWEVALTLAILAGIVDTVYRSRNAARYAPGGDGSVPGAIRRTRKQLAGMRRDGYLALEARPIPDSREFIDHLVIGPTGVYAIDSEKWDPRLPIRTWNGKKLYHGPESQKDRLEHAAWEAQQASEILSGALGTEIAVRPALAIYGPKIPWDIATIRNVDVFTGTALRKYLKQRSRMRGRGKDGAPSLTGEQVRAIYEAATAMLPDVVPTAPSGTYTPVG